MSGQSTEFDHTPYLHPDDGHTLDCAALASGGWSCSSECPERHLALARAVHRLKFPNHADCEPNTVEVRDARLHLEALAMAFPPGSTGGAA